MYLFNSDIVTFFQLCHIQFDAHARKVDPYC